MAIRKPGIQVDIPGFHKIDLRVLVTDYTGTHACGGVLVPGARERLVRLSELLDIHVLTSDTFGTVKKELAGIPHTLRLLDGKSHDKQKAKFIWELIRGNRIAAFGNGRNDRLMLRAVRQAGGIAVAIDNGEGCAVEAQREANVFVHGSIAALDLLFDTNRLKATLRA
ncbi:hypothetical protein A2761_03350 [Candidatus Kaiserbacteria bacterium RIFCSPHIGHO2_01_FULL_51_33]|uniref:ATPase P n=1 Tax=Candidatus Kaiserbacteria bacterium RIFCSPLOWO2_01_FULL_51_21 TaxID=1798508 RepID=A0A1F6EEB4_9BACT|nr:MAG: hypothetical protein A2761_03350 [Candidatus Kaiserbacteria bacterium RIFCSPHIGHO2_01_FULL_51_33]OGG71986.1 MAG: hypothetical protein A3A35_01180 [Candidatus Kaiserbacteria bacterium RIFCSPLOWO2_01_FULL_51_21]